tara:strand:+ start:79 stop:1188 length:1110 start_codon:yes stop_codon:yes gene_type:complete
MLRSVFENEATIKTWEVIRDYDHNALAGRCTSRRRACLEGGKPKTLPYFVERGETVYVDSDTSGRSVVRPLIESAKHRRDDHLDELRHLIDYALTTVAYDDVPCPGCQLPADPLSFIRALPEFEQAAIQCKTCKGLGTARQKKTSKEAKASFKLISHFKRVLDDTALVAKIRSRTDESSDAYLELEAKNKNLLSKFGNEKGSQLEGDDAAQGVRQGILDACRLYDPTDSRMAAFNTVAYWWCRRNSRARHQGQKRHGLYALSSDAIIVDKEKGRAIGEFLVVKDGAFASADLNNVGRGAGDTLSIDLRDNIAKLPENQAKVVVDVMGGYLPGQIAARHGFSKGKVRCLKERAFAALRESMVGYVEALHD